ncbi:MAG: hypothetical protein QME87_02070 [Bacillota bacterium]|nr:hypothetical protein [Bacillota bacterium]
MNRDRSGDRGRLEELVQSADPDDLQDLILRLASTHPEVRKECCSFLGSRVPTADEAAARAVFSLWDELEPDLEELDARGGGDEEQEDRVAELLREVADKLAEGRVPREDRRALLDEVIPYIASANSGMEDSLYDVAYAACYDDEDLRDLAGRLEALNKPWPLEHARRIYRRTGDREKYLALRALDMEYGLDYCDLATSYWETGERDLALGVAREGLEKGKGRLDELRQVGTAHGVGTGESPRHRGVLSLHQRCPQLRAIWLLVRILRRSDGVGVLGWPWLSAAAVERCWILREHADRRAGLLRERLA